MSAEISESDLLGKVEETHPLHALQQAIAAMPDMDEAKVAAVLLKLRNQQLDINGSAQEQLACAERIARQILDESL